MDTKYNTMFKKISYTDNIKEYLKSDKRTSLWGSKKVLSCSWSNAHKHLSTIFL